MSILESYYHFTKTGAYKYQLVSRSGKQTRLDALFATNTVATVKTIKRPAKKRPYRFFAFSVKGQPTIKGFTIMICYDDVAGSGSGRTHLFYDNCIVVIEGNDLFIYMHKMVCVTSLTSNTGMTDESKLYIGSDKDSPYNRYLKKDESILSEMKLLTLNTTKV